MTWLYFELFLLFAGLPVVFISFDVSRLVLFSSLWGCCLGALVYLRRAQGLSWHAIWSGHGWTARQKRQALYRFLALLPVLLGLTLWIAPDRFLDFPLGRPRLWLLVMCLYPLLSALPQAVLYRAFFFARYEKAFSSAWIFWITNGLCFALAHGFYHNLVAPSLTFFGGILFSYSFAQHRSLKWMTLEHAAYGCLLFTLGLGTYFFRSALN